MLFRAVVPGKLCFKYHRNLVSRGDVVEITEKSHRINFRFEFCTEVTEKVAGVWLSLKGLENLFGNSRLRLLNIAPYRSVSGKRRRKIKVRRVLFFGEDP